MQKTILQRLAILVAFAASAFATHTYLRHMDAEAHEAWIRQSYVDALIRDFSREADFLAMQIEAAKQDSIRLEALIARTNAEGMTMEGIVALIQAELGPVVDARNPFGFGSLGAIYRGGMPHELPKEIRRGLTTILDLHHDIRYETAHHEWLVAQNAAWKGDAMPRVFSSLVLKRYSLATLTDKRRHLLTETRHMLALLNQTES